MTYALVNPVSLSQFGGRFTPLPTPNSKRFTVTTTTANTSSTLLNADRPEEV